MENAKGEVTLKSSFVPELKRDLGGGFGSAFINETLEKGAASLSTNDYLSLFKEFSKFDGEYYEIDRNNKKIDGHYEVGEQIGRWQIYCENGQLEQDRTYARQKNEQGNEQTIEIGDTRVNTCDGEVLLSANRNDSGKLDGQYIENTKPYGADSSEPLPKYLRNYVDGELDGEQKEYDRSGKLALENNFVNGVKEGRENVYASSQNRLFRSQEEGKHWLSETLSYSSGQKDGSYSKFDSNDRLIESGQYKDGQPVGLWKKFDLSKHTQQLIDYNPDNFILEKVKGFKDACHLPKSAWSGIDWNHAQGRNTSDCEHFVVESVVDINRKLVMETYSTFEKSGDWTYPAIVAAPNFYEYMKKHGLKTRVTDSFGRTRLHVCLSQLRSQTRRQGRCNSEQAISYIADVDINSVSNSGTALHQIASPRTYNAKRKEIVDEELIIARSLIENGAKVNQLNHKSASPLMIALSTQQYDLAEMLIDAGATSNGQDVNGKTTLGYFFIDERNRWLKSKVSTQGTRVLAKVIASGVDANEIVLADKTVRDFSEENNTLHHIKTLKEATVMSAQFKGALGARASQQPEPISSSSSDNQAETININSDASEKSASVFSAPQPSNQNIAESEIKASASSAASVDSRLNPAPVDSDPASVVTSEAAASPIAQESEAQALLRQQAEFLVEQANEHIANFRLQTPENNSALGSLNQLKRIDPKNQNIIEIERAIGEKYLGLASGKIEQGDKAAAQRHLDSAAQFVSNKTVLADYQTRVNNTKVVARNQDPINANQNSVAASTAVTENVQAQEVNSGPAIICDPDVKSVGVPVLGRTFTARQSLPRTEQQILSKSMEAIRKDYSNIRESGNTITFEQKRNGPPLRLNLSVRPDGNNSMLTVVAKIPAGVLTTKAGIKTSFCNLIESF